MCRMQLVQREPSLALFLARILEQGSARWERSLAPFLCLGETESDKSEAGLDDLDNANKFSSKEK
jgi:hypothetical protein